ncbi:MAG: hypothetical protein LBS86_00025, partial [Treponema sp.]|nr:hypothetical protein [Treponema sp.]
HVEAAPRRTAQSTPLSIKARTDAHFAGRKTSPEEIKTSPEEINTSPEEINTSPEKIKTSPEKIKTSPKRCKRAKEKSPLAFP